MPRSIGSCCSVTPLFPPRGRGCILDATSSHPDPISRVDSSGALRPVLLTESPPALRHHPTGEFLETPLGGGRRIPAPRPKSPTSEPVRPCVACSDGSSWRIHIPTQSPLSLWLALSGGSSTRRKGSPRFKFHRPARRSAAQFNEIVSGGPAGAWAQMVPAPARRIQLSSFQKPRATCPPAIPAGGFVFSRSRRRITSLPSERVGTMRGTIRGAWGGGRPTGAASAPKGDRLEPDRSAPANPYMRIVKERSGDNQPL